VQQSTHDTEHSLSPHALQLQLVFALVSQENIPLGPLATLMPLLQMAGLLNETTIKNSLKVSISPAASTLFLRLARTIHL